MTRGAQRPWDRTRRVLGPVIAPIYKAVVGRRNRKFDLGVGVQRSALPVVSIGNLTTGGTGKTPLTAWLCRELSARGVKPLIAMRGYKGGEQGSDEAAEYRRLLPGVRVAVNPDRVAGIEAALEGGAADGADCVVLDDGFQHRRLHRDLDIVLIDASRDIFAERILPLGDLREPLVGLRRAGVIVLTHAERVDAGRMGRLRTQLAELLGKRSGLTLIITARHEWGGLTVSERGVERSEPVAWLNGRRAIVACAIGAPAQFVDRVSRECEVASAVVLPDHDPMGPDVVQRICDHAKHARAGVIVVTEKDWSKLARVDGTTWPCPVVRPRLAMQVEGAEQLLAAVLKVVPGRATGPAKP